MPVLAVQQFVTSEYYYGIVNSHYSGGVTWGNCPLISDLCPTSGALQQWTLGDLVNGTSLTLDFPPPRPTPGAQT